MFSETSRTHYLNFFQRADSNRKEIEFLSGSKKNHTIQVFIFIEKSIFIVLKRLCVKFMINYILKLGKKQNIVLILCARGLSHFTFFNKVIFDSNEMKKYWKMQGIIHKNKCITNMIENNLNMLHNYEELRYFQCKLIQLKF